VHTRRVQPEHARRASCSSRLTTPGPRQVRAMEGADCGWDDTNMPQPSLTGAFDVGMAFTEAELDFILYEGCCASPCTASAALALF